MSSALSNDEDDTSHLEERARPSKTPETWGVDAEVH